MCNHRHAFFSFFLAFLNCAFSTFAAAQTAATGEITIAAKWKQGERHTYAVTRSKVGAKAVPVEVKYNVVAVVEAAHAKGYTVSLRIEGLALPENFAELPPFRDAPAAELMKSLPQNFVIETDETGNIESLKNWQEIAQKMGSFVELVLKSDQTDVLKNVRVMVRSIYADEPSTRQTALRDLDAIFSPLGDTLTPGKPLKADTKMNVLLLGELVGKETYLLTQDKPKAGVFFHEFTREIDPVSFSQAVARMVGKLAPERATQVRGSIEFLLVRDRNESEIDSKTGWLLRAQRIREVGPQGAAPLETSTLTVVRQ